MSVPARVLTFITNNLLNHKKKYIALLMLACIAYYAKKKLSTERMLLFFMKIIKVLEYIPLPEAPEYRPLAQLDMPPPFDFSALKQFLNTQLIVDEIRQAKNNPELGTQLWSKMAQNVFAGYGFVLSMYDLTQVFGMVRSKYVQQFRYFGAEQHFNLYIDQMVTAFGENLQNVFQYIRKHQQSKVEGLNAAVKIDPAQLYQILSSLSEGLFQFKYNIYERRGIVKSKQFLDADVRRLYYTNLEKEKPGKQKGKIMGALSWLWGALTIPTIQDHTYEPTEERFSIVREMFRMDRGKINNIRARFQDNNKALQLFDLVNAQIHDTLSSLNFHNLWCLSVKYNTQKFLNRLELVLQRKGGDQMLLGSCLSIISKICMEEFVTPNSHDTNKRFLEKELKEALNIRMNAEAPNDKVVKQKNMLVDELIVLKRLQTAKSEFVLKYLHERSGMDVQLQEPTNPGMDKNMREFLASIAQQGGDSPQA